MGEARRRGTREQRRAEAIARKKRALVESLGGRNDRDDRALRAGMSAFLQRITPEAWKERRSALVRYLNGVTNGTQLESADAVRYRQDEIAWYLFLAEQALEDPLCMDVAQAARNLPFIASIGERWAHHSKVEGLGSKLDEILGKHKSDPDGLIFEILVALSYAANGWAVKFLDASPAQKTADLRVSKGGREFVVECKRQSRRSEYAEAERNAFLRRWDEATEVLFANRQWLWFDCTIHVEAQELPENFFSETFRKILPLKSKEAVVYDGAEATVRVRQIDRGAVRRHLERYSVKQNSPTLSGLLGGNWAAPDAEVTMAMAANVSHVVECEAPVLGGYVEEITWACGMTRKFDAEQSIDKKARDVKSLLARGVRQVPQDTPSIIHIAVETLEGEDVERRRTEKVMSSIPYFVTSKPVAAVRLHRLQPNMPVDKLWEFDETVERFERKGADVTELPEAVLLPLDTPIKDGTHWK